MLFVPSKLLRLMKRRPLLHSMMHTITRSVSSRTVNTAKTTAITAPADQTTCSEADFPGSLARETLPHAIVEAQVASRSRRFMTNKSDLSQEGNSSRRQERELDAST